MLFTTLATSKIIIGSLLLKVSASSLMCLMMPLKQVFPVIGLVAILTCKGPREMLENLLDDD